ncbi:MAG: tyrosine-protein phosphatase [Mycobacteriales bacterium]
MSWIELEGAANVRDVGGLPTVDGRATRRGVLLRADNLQGLTPTDVARVTGELGVRTVVDLRTTGELHLEGNGPLRHTDLQHHHVPLIPEGADEPDQAEVDRAVPHRPDRAGRTPTDMTGYYVGYVEDAPQNLARALHILADPATGPALVHCAAGKDRTGVVVAAALSMAGVTRDAVVADYVRSAERIEAVLARLQSSATYAPSLAGVQADDLRPVAGSMERFLDHVDRAYGGPHGLAMTIGVDEETVARLGARLVGTSPVAR